jgi:hypothetical protein
MANKVTQEEADPSVLGGQVLSTVNVTDVSMVIVFLSSRRSIPLDCWFFSNTAVRTSNLVWRCIPDELDQYMNVEYGTETLVSIKHEFLYYQQFKKAVCHDACYNQFISSHTAYFLTHRCASFNLSSICCLYSVLAKTGSYEWVGSVVYWGRSRSACNLLKKNWDEYSNSWFAILNNLLVPMFCHFTKGTSLLFQIHIFAKLIRLQL